MLRLLALIIWLAPGAFVASPLTADDRYGAPDPGWYQQGSGYRPDASTGQSDSGDSGSGGYHYDDFRDGADDSGAYQPYAWSRGGDDGSAYVRPNYDQPSYDQPSYDQPDSRRYASPRRRGDDARRRRSETAEPDPERRSPNGYGAPDWAQQPLPRDRDPAGYADDQVDAWADDWAADWAADWALEQQWRSDGGRYTDDPGWRRPPARPRYRFREDPDLEQAAADRRLDDYQFRPLSKREQERHHDADRDPRFADPYSDGRYRSPTREQRRRKGERGTAFGYAPLPGRVPPDDFYRRYYRSQP
ncbi:MAG: hypothetical protein GVY09_06140 [Gammaproteobacteria bacterium]|jgi:hypothetical protein|nr:hypothetical protein [Gammaproteobacteria bacterium]